MVAFSWLVMYKWVLGRRGNARGEARGSSKKQISLGLVGHANDSEVCSAG